MLSPNEKCQITENHNDTQGDYTYEKIYSS